MIRLIATALLGATTLAPGASEPPDVENGYGAIVGADFGYADPTMSDPDGSTVTDATLFVYVDPVSTSEHVVVVELTVDQARMIVKAAEGIVAEDGTFLP